VVSKWATLSRTPKKRSEGLEMFKSLIPALTIAVIGNSIAMAQFFGTPFPAQSGFSQPQRPFRIARANDNEPLASPADNLDDLDALDALDVAEPSVVSPNIGVPSASDKNAPAPSAVDTPADSPQSLLTPSLLEPPASLDASEQLELPMPKEPEVPATGNELNPANAEISAQDLESLQPAPVPQTAEPQNQVEPSVAPVTPIPGPIDFDHAIQQQQRDLAYAATQNAGNIAGSRSESGCQCNGQSNHGCGGHPHIPYRAPILPPSNSFHGHFKANPCYYDLWANYPAEAAAACAHNRAKLAPRQKIGCQSCELVDPCPCR
jgi:hypothetical protein